MGCSSHCLRKPIIYFPTNALIVDHEETAIISTFAECMKRYYPSKSLSGKKVRPELAPIDTAHH